MKYFLILCLILSYNLVSAQKNLLSGRIEMKNGQIIDGKIVFRGKSVTPQEIEFIDQTGKSQKYNPSELESFEIEDRKFVSRCVSIDVTPQRLQKKDYLNSRNQISDTIFIGLQVQSEISLYYYKEVDHQEHFFIRNDEGEIIELIKHEYFDKVRNPDNGIYEEKLISYDKYRNQLSYAFKACPSVVEKLGNLTFKLNEIKKLVIKYNECRSNNIEYTSSNEKIKIKFGVTMGVASQSLKFDSNADEFQEFVDMEMDPYISAVFGGTVDIIFPNNYNRWTLSNLFLYVPFDYQSSIFVPSFVPSVYDNADYSISGSYIKLLSKMRYFFANKKLRPFINAGVSVAYLSGYSAEMEREIVTYGNIRHVESSVLKKSKQFEMGLEIGAGLKIGNRFLVEYIYEGSDGMSKYARLKSHFDRNYILVNYLF